MKFRERLMIACAGLLCIACVITCVRYGTHQVLVRKLKWDNSLTRTVFADNMDLQHDIPLRNIPGDEVPVDWAQKYPYPAAPPQEQENEGFLSATARKFHERTSRFETWTNERFWAYRSIADVTRKALQVTKWNVPLFTKAESDNFQYKEDYFASLLPRRDETQQMEATADLAAFCKERGIHFVVFLVPWKFSRSSPYDDTLDFANDNADAYLSGLRERGVDVIDLRTYVEHEGWSYDDLFFKSDHHWTLATARWAASLLATHLNDVYGYQVDTSLLDDACFDQKKYPSWFYGTYAIKLGASYAKPDDFYLPYPKEPTAFHIVIPSMDIDCRGDISVLYNMEEMKPGRYTYHAYAYGDRALVTICNERKRDGKHLLLLHDSYGCAAAPFLALGMERLDLIDPRYFTGSLRTYVEKEHPDTVVLCYGAIQFNLDDFVHFPKKPFDFR